MIVRTTKWIEENETDYKKEWVCLSSLQKEIENKISYLQKYPKGNVAIAIYNLRELLDLCKSPEQKKCTCLLIRQQFERDKGNSICDNCGGVL